MKADTTIAAWDAATVPQGDADWHPGDTLLCDAISRDIALAAVLAGERRADARLNEAAAIDREMRQLQAQLEARVQAIDALAGKAPENSLSRSARERALTNVYLNLHAMADLRAQAGPRAAVWAHREAAIRATPLSSHPASCRHAAG